MTPDLSLVRCKAQPRASVPPSIPSDSDPSHRDRSSACRDPQLRQGSLPLVEVEELGLEVERLEEAHPPSPLGPPAPRPLVPAPLVESGAAATHLLRVSEHPLPPVRPPGPAPGPRERPPWVRPTTAPAPAAPPLADPVPGPGAAGRVTAGRAEVAVLLEEGLQLQRLAPAPLRRQHVPALYLPASAGDRVPPRHRRRGGETVANLLPDAPSLGRGPLRASPGLSGPKAPRCSGRGYLAPGWESGVGPGIVRPKVSGLLVQGLAPGRVEPTGVGRQSFGAGDRAERSGGQGAEAGGGARTRRWGDRRQQYRVVWE